MPILKISEIATVVNAKLIGLKDIPIEHLALDSRKLVKTESSLFVAIVGRRHDGHQYIEEMYKKGVRAFLISSQEFIDSAYIDAGFLFVSNTLTALQVLSAWYRKKYNIPVVGITGSNGKTIVKEWLAQSLATKYRVTRSPKSYNSQIGVPLSVWLLDTQTEWAVFEAGISLPEEMQKLETILKPDKGIITNIGEAHQQGFSNIDQKLQEKLKLFKQCKQIYFCSDHTLIAAAIHNSEDLNGKELISWSNKDASSSVFIEKSERVYNTTQVHAKYKGQESIFQLPFVDKASVENALHVVCFLLHNRFTHEEVINCLESLTPVAMRLEQVKGVKNCTLINDSYNSDINSLSIALDYLNQLSNTNKVLILSDIEQSGLANINLYQKVSDLISEAKISKFIGIGEAISSSAEFFDSANSIFFKNTSEFLQSIEIQEVNNQFVLIKGARGFQFENIVSRLSEKKHTTVLETNLNYLTENLNYFRSLLRPQTALMVMVKALAYGSGGIEIANLLQHEKVDYLGVAFTDEGVQLRQSGIVLPIMVMSPVIEDFNRIIEYDLEPEIYSLRVLKSFISVAKSLQISNYPIQIKLDTGMHRLGFLEEEIPELIDLLKASDTVKVKAVFSHLAASDDSTQDSFTKEQFLVFERAYSKLTDTVGYKPKRHILNSAGIERFPEAHLEMVRLGIGLHGISAVNSNLMPVSTLKTHISQIKEIKLGETIGYGRKGIAEKGKKIAIIPIGYADGLDRKFGNNNGYVMLKNTKVSYIGSICMDMSMIDVTGIDCEEGDEVIVFGKEPSIIDLADRIQTIPYEILTNVSSRVKRVFIKD